MVATLAQTKEEPMAPTSSSCIPKVPIKLALVGFAVAFSSSFQFGYATTYINTAQFPFMNYVNGSLIHRYGNQLSTETLNWIWAIAVNSVQIGIAVATLMVPFLTERFGRRWTLLTSIIPEALGICMSIVALSFQMTTLFILGRFITSIGAGLAVNAATLFLQEISPTNVRGFVSSFQEFSLCISCVLGLVFGLPSVLGGQSRLTYLVAVGLFGAFLRLILLFGPESPKYLLLKRGDEPRAIKSIEFYHGPDVNVKHVLHELDREDDLDENKNSEKKMSTFKQIWVEKHMRKAVILGTVVYLAIEATGIVPIYEFSTDILVDSGLSVPMAELGSLIMALCNTVSTFISILVVERFGRRKLLLFGLVGIILCLTSLTAFDLVNHLHSGTVWAGYGAMVSLIGHSMIYSIGPGPISWFITAELVPQHVRSSAQAITQMGNMAADIFISFVFFPMFTMLGPYTFLILCIGPSIACTVYLFFELPETKNREISDIVMEIKRTQRKNSDQMDNLVNKEKF